MMEKENSVSSHQAYSQTNVSGLTSTTPPTCEKCADGQSVENVPNWYVVRATHGRAQKIYDAIVALCSPLLEVYMPRYHYETLTLSDGNPEKTVTEGPLHNGLLFVRATRSVFSNLIHAREPFPVIKGLTPYYDHFHETFAGRNDYLVVPDKQFHDFRTILESRDVHILVDQNVMPTYLNGKQVEIISGPFAGVTGTMLRWKGLRRVFVQLDNIGTYATGFVRTCDFRLLD